MKKTILVLLIAVLAIGFVFAEGEEKDHGKIVVGVKAGYLPNYKMAQFDANAKWQLDFNAVAPFTTDAVATFGVITDFKDNLIFDGYIGAGLTKDIGENWDVYANSGLDIMFDKDFCELGVAAHAGFDFYPVDFLGLNVDVKAVEYIKSRAIVFEPSVGVNYAF